MRIAIVGAGAMGCLYGGLLARAGEDVVLIDAWADHVAAIARDGLRLDGITGDLTIAVAAAVSAAGVAPVDAVLVQTNTTDTAAAAETAAAVLKPAGYALTLQNGVGNVESLAEVLGPGRVLGGLSYHSAAGQGPGHVTHTHAGPTWIGELDGARSPRLKALDALLWRAGFEPVIVDDIMGFIWNKFIHNCAINPISAVTGLRGGEIARDPAADALQTRIVEEALAVVRAKGIALPEADPLGAIKAFCRIKYNKPSMLQHVEQGKLTEIDALNATVVREGRALGIPTPYNEALTWMVRAVADRSRRRLLEPEPDYDALEAAAKKAK